MLELVKVLGGVNTIPQLPDNYPISMKGMDHIAFQIDDMQKTVEQIQEKGVPEYRYLSDEKWKFVLFLQRSGKKLDRTYSKERGRYG